MKLVFCLLQLAFYTLHGKNVKKFLWDDANSESLIRKKFQVYVRKQNYVFKWNNVNNNNNKQKYYFCNSLFYKTEYRILWYVTYMKKSIIRIFNFLNVRLRELIMNFHFRLFFFGHLFKKVFIYQDYTTFFLSLTLFLFFQFASFKKRNKRMIVPAKLVSNSFRTQSD